MLNHSALTLAVALAGSLFTLAPEARAEQAEIDALKRQLQEISARLQQLENQQATRDSTSENAADSLQRTNASASGDNTEVTSADQPDNYYPLAQANEALTFYGLVEVEAGYSDHPESGSGSDLTAATVEMGLAAQLTDNMSANVSVLYEEDETDLEIDVASISFADLGGSGLDLTLGQTYLPFGYFETYLTNDTLLLELAETRETSTILSWEHEGFSLSAYAFNGEVDGGADTLKNYGAALSWSDENFGIGVDYTSNILESDGLSAAFAEDGLDLAAVDNSAAAYIVQLSANVSRLILLAEYLDAERFSIGSFEQRELQAVHLEAATDVGAWTLALAWQESDSGARLVPEQRLSLGASTSLNDSVGVGVEFWRDKDYAGADADNLLLQVNVQF